jgi:excisionase family DNA binding protein
MVDFPVLMTASEVAELVKVNPRTVRRWAEDGHLEAVRIAGHTVRLTATSVRELLSLEALLAPTGHNDLEAAGRDLEGKAGNDDAQAER